MPDEPYTVPIGQAAVRTEGKDLTIVGYAPQTAEIAKAVRELKRDGIRMATEYRYTAPLFKPGFFNGTYDLERAQIVQGTTELGQDSMYVETKDQRLINNPYALSGYFGSATMNLFNLVDFTAGYQKLIPADTSAEESNSFIANLSLNTDMIPKISEAVAYYVRNNDPNPFKFDEPSANTTWGYRMGYELGPGISLVYNFQESYRDLNGNGIIDSDEEKVRILSVETAFNF